MGGLLPLQWLHMMLLYLLFIHVTLLVPGYVFIKNLRLFSGRPGLELCAGYFSSLAFAALLGILGYLLKISPFTIAIFHWMVLIFSLYFFVRQGLFRELRVHRFPLLILLAMTLFSYAFITLHFAGPTTYIPDPAAIPGNNYQAFNVKVLNVAQTVANDNSVPYRQAQFMVNRLDPGKDNFIDEWGVHFFQRTPFMGAVTAEYFTLTNEHVPTALIWEPAAADPGHTYMKFQMIAQTLNALLVLPAFFLITRFFSRRTAQVTLLFIVPSQFFLYNSFFSWPKSFAAFFILFSWMLLFEKGKRAIIMAGIAAGCAYLTHDLAVLYGCATGLFLLYHKRIRDLLIFGALNALFALPWLIASTFIYKKPSTFAFYPLSIHDIPQASQKRQVVREFLHTSPLRLLAIRLENIIYLLTPYQLLTSEGGQALGRRLWAVSLFNAPGAMGLGLIIPAIVGAWKRIRHIDFWILSLTPILACAIFIGWPKGLGALHFAEASVTLLMGLGIWFLLTRKKRAWWILLAYAINLAQTIFFATFSYGFRVGAWVSSFGGIIRVAMLMGIAITCGLLAFYLAQQPAEKQAKRAV